MSSNKWLEWAKELQFLSQCALAYRSDPYDIERFQRIREISAEMFSGITDLPLDLVKATFCAGTGYQTPKLDTRAAVLRSEWLQYGFVPSCSEQNRHLRYKQKGENG